MSTGRGFRCSRANVASTPSGPLEHRRERLGVGEHREDDVGAPRALAGRGARRGARVASARSVPRVRLQTRTGKPSARPGGPPSVDPSRRARGSRPGPRASHARWPGALAHRRGGYAPTSSANARAVACALEARARSRAVAAAALSLPAVLAAGSDGGIVRPRRDSLALAATMVTTYPIGEEESARKSLPCRLRFTAPDGTLATLRDPHMSADVVQADHRVRAEGRSAAGDRAADARARAGREAPGAARHHRLAARRSRSRTSSQRYEQADARSSRRTRRSPRSSTAR